MGPTYKFWPDGKKELPEDADFVCLIQVWFGKDGEDNLITFTPSEGFNDAYMAELLRTIADWLDYRGTTVDRGLKRVK